MKSKSYPIIRILIGLLCAAQVASADVTIPAGTVGQRSNLDFYGNSIYRARNIYLRDGDTNTMSVAAPSLASDSISWIFPSTNGSNGSILKTDGAGATSWLSTLPIANGGTGQTSATAALNALLPSQTGNAGEVLTTDGTDASWAAGLTSNLANGSILIGDGSGVATARAVTGDVTISNTGVTAIGTSKVTTSMVLNGAILNEDINGSADIAGSKLQAAASGNAGAVSTGNQTFGGRKSAGNSKAAVYRATNDTAVGSGSWYAIPFDSEEYDTNGEFSGGRFTATRAGYYMVTVTAQFGTFTDGKLCQIAIGRNGASEFLSIARQYFSGGSQECALAVSAVVYLNGTTDYVGGYGFHNQGSNQTLFGGQYTTRISIAELL